MRKPRCSMMLLVLAAISIVVVTSSSSSTRRLAFGTIHGRRLSEAFVVPLTKETLLMAPSWSNIPRGGGVGLERDDDDEEEEDEDEDLDETDVEDNDEDSDTEQLNRDQIKEKKDATGDNAKDEQSDDDETDDADISASSQKSSIASAPPVAILLKTGNSPLLHQTIELTVHRSRNIASLKQTASRQLPGRPPVSTIQIVYAGRILPDDTLVDELVEEEEDEDEDDDEEVGNKDEAKLVLQLDMIPPVDPTYFRMLQQKLPEMTTAEILDAYAANEAALYHNTAVLIQEQHKRSNDDEDDEELSASPPSNTLVSLQLKQYQDSIQNDLRTKLLTSNEAKNILADEMSPSARLGAMTTEVRGHRVRNMAAAGLKTSIKRSIQTQFNVSWPDLIRNILLFLFFGYFGGRTASARAILLLGAPLTVLIQLRSIKQILKCFMYAVLDHPAGIFLSLLPAPQQTILSMNVETALQNIYGDRIKHQNAMKGVSIDDDIDEAPSPSLAVLQEKKGSKRSTSAENKVSDDAEESDSEEDAWDEEDEDEEDYW